jgi:peroxiredoxin (alkyl hydroperoxide reductase subunit C)
MKKLFIPLLILATTAGVLPAAASDTNIIVFNPGHLKPVDSRLKVKVGERAPDFTLPCIKGGTVSLNQFRGKKNVVISFEPAAFTIICSAQWPGYNLVLNDVFTKHDAVLLGISTDNIPSLYAWDQQMGGMRFDILSDFFPQGKVASAFGVLRHDGMAERALFVVDKKGIIRYVDVHDINKRPPLEDLVAALDKLPK